jgi:hypothetical protein
MSLLSPDRSFDDLVSDFDRAGHATTLAVWVRWLSAICAGGAAVLHFAFAPSHFSQYWLYGVFFVGIGWAQLTWAVGALFRPTRWVIFSGIALNTAVIVVWILSRTDGVLIGPNASVSEPATFPDVLATVLEALAVVAAMALLARPRILTRGIRARWLAPAALTGALVLTGTSVGYSLTPRFGHSHVHADGAGLTGATPCELAGPPATQGQVFDAAGHSHRGATAQVPIAASTRLVLQAQQEIARDVAIRYPTVADAERGGYRKSTVYVPCIGAHYTNVPLAVRFDPAAPSELLYDGTAADARIVGLSYLVWHPGGAPDGFAGPNDRWHQHTFNGGLCIDAGGVVVGAEDTTQAECVRRGGAKTPLTDVWMLHDWVVPGFECSWGVFAAECPELGGRLGGTAWDVQGVSVRR